MVVVDGVPTVGIQLSIGLTQTIVRGAGYSSDNPPAQSTEGHVSMSIAHLGSPGDSRENWQ
ncbi:MAG: hypothetical protein AAB357_02220, partial [Actinomycetota bacterium]